MISTKQRIYQDTGHKSVTLIRAKDLAKHLGISKATLYRWAKDPTRGFPRQINIGPKIAAWRLAEIEQFISRQEGTRGAA